MPEPVDPTIEPHVERAVARSVLPGSRHVIHVAIVCLLVAAGTASAAIGNMRLARYFVSDPIGGSPLPQADLQAKVTGIQRAVSTIDAGAMVAAQAWTNATTHTEFMELAAAVTQRVPEPGARSRTAVTLACGVAHGSVRALHSIAAVPNAYEATCLVPSKGKVELVEFVKVNVVVGLNVMGPGFSLASLETLAMRQYRLIPGSGIVIPATGTTP